MGDASTNKTSIESLHSEHVDLGRDVAALRKLLASEFEWAAMEAALSSFARRLDEHFEFEESGNFFPEVLEIDPNRAREIDRLHDEHKAMRNDLSAARHAIVDGAVDRDTLRDILKKIAKATGGSRSPRDATFDGCIQHRYRVRRLRRAAN